MIIQAGMRTDIPAFYSEWFMNRIREGFVLVRNPYNASAVTRYNLSPSVVDLISFCTKNPAPMLPYIDELKCYGQYWFVTITPYGKDIEPNVPDKHLVMEHFKAIAKILGPNCMGWRYDPIFVSARYSVEYHVRAFSKMCETLAGSTHTCVISFIDLYEKVKRNFPEVRLVTQAERIALGQVFVEVARKYDITVKACAEGKELESYGVNCEGCATVETYELALGQKLNVPKKPYARSECACILGNDIGAYNTCSHFCKYCYANYDHATVLKNMKMHNPKSPFIIGESLPGDIIRNAEQKSFKVSQLALF